MLRILRNKKTAKRVWIGLAIIIIPAFTLWGFSGAFRNKEESKPVGKITGHRITPLEFKDSLSAVNVSAIMQFGDNLPQVEKYLNLPSQAWSRLVLLYEAKRRGIKVSDDEVIDAIQNNPLFQSNKIFNDRLYNQTLRYVFRVQPRAFEEQARQNQMLQKLYLQVTGGLTVDEKQLISEYESANQEVSISYVGSLIADFAKKIKPKEKQINAYYEKNKALYKEPLLTIKNKVKETLINETAKTNAEEKINKCANLLKKYALKQAASKCGQAIKNPPAFKSGIQIEGLGQTDIFWQKAKTLKPKQTSEIIKTPAGSYIIELKSILPIDDKKFQKEKAGLSDKLLQQKKQEKFNQFADELTKKSPNSF